MLFPVRTTATVVDRGKSMAADAVKKNKTALRGESRAGSSA